MAILRNVLAALIVLGCLVQAASADESVYKGKQVVILVSADAGTSYDLYPRTRGAAHRQVHSRKPEDRGEEPARRIGHGGRQLALQHRQA